MSFASRVPGIVILLCAAAFGAGIWTAPQSAVGGNAFEAGGEPCELADPRIGDEPAQPILTPSPTPGTPVATASPTPSPTSITPTPSPTSYRVADVGVTAGDSHDPVAPGERFRYVLGTGNAGPAMAPNGQLRARLPEGGPITFTGALTVTPSGAWTCSPPSGGTGREIGCQSIVVYSASVELEAVVDAAAPNASLEMCAEIGFVSPGGGSDPDPTNNRDCESTTIAGPPPVPTVTAGTPETEATRLYLPFAARSPVDVAHTARHSDRRRTSAARPEY